MVKSYFGNLVTGGLVFATLSTALIASSMHVGASDEASDTFNINVPSICTMGGTIGTGEAHTTSLQPGTYVPNIGKTTMSVHCNDSEGFSIYAVGFTGDQSTGENHTKLVGNNANNTISTGTTTGSSESDASSWAMKVTAVNGTYKPTVPDGTGGTQNFTSYHAVPEEYTKIASFNSNTDAEGQGSVGSNIETTYAVYVNLEQATDTYTGKVKYTLVHPANHVSPDTAEYNTTVTLGANVKTVTFESNSTEPQTVSTSGSTISLYDGVTYTITATTDNGYELASWTTNEYGTIGNTTQNPTTFTATGTTTLTATAQVQLPEHTCTKEYRLQNADGTYPSTYTSDGTETLRQGSTCTYTKSVENYQTQTDTATMTTDQTISLDLPRNTYELTINKDNTHITTVTGAGTYRWGETVNITATPASGSRFTTWTQTSGTTSTFGNATSATTTFTMPIGAATISAGGETIPSYSVTVTLDSNTTSVGFYNADLGTQNVTTNGGTASLRSGVEYIITATFANGYELDHWTVGSNATIGSTTTNPTTLTIDSATTLSITSKVYVPEPQPSTAGCINYFANASNAVGTMGCQSATDNASVTLLASNFSRTGYGFAGWSDSYDYATNSNAKFYGPNETITVPTGTTANGLSLYAVWIESQGSLQNSSTVASVCNSLTTAPIDGTANLSSVSALTDQRDNQTYAIARLADGKCWMIENMRLDNTNSDNSTGALAQGYGGQFAGLADPETPWANNIATANSLYSTDGADDTINIGTRNAGHRFPRYNNQNIASRANTITTNYNSIYSYGNYYTWAATMANTDDLINSSASEAANTSLCPTGWTLPTSGSASKDFGVLDVAFGGTGTTSNTSSTPTGAVMSAKYRSYPNNFLYSGGVSGSSVSNRGSNGAYWSKSTGSSSSVDYLYFLSSSVDPSFSYSKYRGLSVRCLAQ